MHCYKGTHHPSEERLISGKLNLLVAETLPSSVFFGPAATALIEPDLLPWRTVLCDDDCDTIFFPCKKETPDPEEEPERNAALGAATSCS